MENIISSIIGSFLSGLGALLVIWFQSGKLKSDNRADFEVWKNNIRELVNSLLKESLEDIKSEINKHDIYFLNNENKFNDLKASLQLISEQNVQQTKLLEKHEVKLSMYNDTECLLKEVRETVNHSMDILSKEDKQLASEYLYLVSAKTCEMLSYISQQGLLTLSRLELDVFTSNAVNDCRTKFEYLFGSDKAKAYFKSMLPIHSYKEQLFQLLDDATVNNIERRFRTLTIRWLEELCANFIRYMYLKKDK